MITIEDRRDCCGCTACYSICPRGAITMHEDREGFLYPRVNLSECVDCGLCDNLCPKSTNLDSRSPLGVYALKSLDRESKRESSSGGIFSLLAERCIERGGVVFGARYDNDWSVVHCSVSDLSELALLRGSKYSQSRMEGCFTQVQRELKSGREVLFSGTPCQVAGLKNYLGVEFQNLTTVDFVCHGVPSPKVWRHYLSGVCEPSKITSINFRDKSKGWLRPQLVIESKESQFSEQLTDNLYFRGLVADVTLRPSCYACAVKVPLSVSDITLGDFWGVERVHPDFFDAEGVSLAVVHSRTMMETLSDLDIEVMESSESEAFRYNPSALESAKSPRARAKFFSEIDGDMIGALSKALQPPLYKRFTRTIRKALTTKKE